MTDLICTECGTTATYADANIADVRMTCDETRSGQHNWEEN